MTSPTPDRDAEMLAELAEMDLSAAKHVHTQLIAATVTAEVADLSLAYQRASRTLRQTLALKAKLARDAAYHTVPARPTSPWDAQVRTMQGFSIDDRMLELQNAVDRVLHAEFPDDEPRREALITRLDRELDDWTEKPDFTVAALDSQVLRACRSLGLSEDLAILWRKLPEPPMSDDDEDDNEEEGDDEDGDHDIASITTAEASAPPTADTG